MRKWFTFLFCIFIATTILGQTDAKIDAVYTLAKIPAPLGVYKHVVQARVSNPGTTTLINLQVTLQVTGANSYTNTQSVDINPGEYTLVSFTAFSPWNLGINSLSVSVPADDNNTNNSAVYSQLVNSNSFGYADNSPTTQSVGYGTGDGMILARYQVSGSGLVKKVKVHISNQAANIGNTVYGVVTQFGSILGQSAPHVITPSDLGSYVDFDIITPPDVSDEFYVGLLQITGGSEFYPVSYQQVTLPTRPNAYFASLVDGSGLVALDNIGRLMIEAVVEIGKMTPFNSAMASTGYNIAGWDFSGLNSPITATATSFDTLLASAPILTRGTGAQASAGIHTFRSPGFLNDGISTANTDYFQFSVSPKTGDTLSLNYLSGNLHANSNAILNSGVNSQFGYSLNGIDFTLIGSPFQSFSVAESFYVSLSGISQLQNILGGATVTFRYYASGEACSADWGFVSLKPGSNGLVLFGRLQSSNTILTSPVVPTGAPFVLQNCNSTLNGSISFSSTGTFSPGNKYTVQLGKMYEPRAGNYQFRSPVTVGNLVSNANSGTVNFSIPSGTSSFEEYVVRVISSEPYVAGSFSQSFSISGQYCKSNNDDKFRTLTSGNWNNLSTWESFNGIQWIAATLVPDENSTLVEILTGHTVTANSNISVRNITIKGTLKILNDAGNKGVLSILSPIFPNSYSIRIDSLGTLQVISSNSVFNDAVINLSGKININGRIMIGDGNTPVANGFEEFATNISGYYFWRQGAVFEWNTTSVFPTNGITYFPDNSFAPIFRISNVAAGFLGGINSTVINGLMEVNTPVTWAGSGEKTFRDGLKGYSTLTQSNDCGKFIINSEFADIPSGTSTRATKKGIIGGSLSIYLSNQGLTMIQGITIPDTAKITVSGPCLSLLTTRVQPGAKLTLQTGSVFNLSDASLFNDGLIAGSGLVQFTGTAVSGLSSTGLITAPILLNNKQLMLEGKANISALSLTNISNILLGQYSLNMSSATLLADNQNFVVTNDTGRLSRYVGAIEVLYPIGINSSSYTPARLTNSGNPGNISARVITGVQTSLPITSGNVDRTWLIGDTTQTNLNLTVKLEWNATVEQPSFDRNNCYVSHYTSCSGQVNCTDYYDSYPAGSATGNSPYNITRSGISNLKTTAFIVSSKQFVFTFTGNGNWSDAANWTPAVVAPLVIPPGVEVYINPSGLCICNGNIKLKQGGKLEIKQGKNLIVTGDLIVE